MPYPTDTSTRREPVAGNAAAGLNNLLASLGVTTTKTRDSIEDSITDLLAERGLPATVVELKWGTLILSAPASIAHLLRFDRDEILAALNAAHPGVVAQLQVRVSVSGRRGQAGPAAR